MILKDEQIWQANDLYYPERIQIIEMGGKK